MRQSKMISRLITIAGIGLASGWIATSAQAASIGAHQISLDCTEQKLTITLTGDTQAYVAYPTVKSVNVTNADKSKSKVSQLVAKEWDIYDKSGDGVTVDLSTLSATKDNYIQVKGNVNTDVVTVKIPAVLSKVSAKFDVSTATVKLYDTTDKNSPAELTDAQREYCTANGNWTAYEDNTLEMYQMRGASLYFRLAANEAETLQNLASEATASTLRDGDGKVISIYEVGSFAGKSIKVTIPKRASAPKVTTDYVNRQLKLPKGTEYRISTTDALGEWKAGSATEAYTLTLEDIAKIDDSLSGVVDVRVVATASKAASKMAQIDLEAPEELSVCTSKEDVDGDAIADSDVFYNGLGNEYEETPIQIGYKYQQSTKAYQGIQVFNYTTNTYEIYIAKDGKVPDATTKATKKIKAKSALAEEDEYEKTELSASSVKVGDKVYIRMAGDAKKQVWSSAYVCLGTVKYDTSMAK